MFNYHKVRLLEDKKQSENKGLKKSDIANGIGISEPGLRNIKTGISIPGADVLEKIAIYFGVDVNYFFDSSPEPPLKEYSGLSPKPMMLNEAPLVYGALEKNPWELLYETQRELIEQKEECMELKVENAQLKNANAIGNTANVG